MRARHGCKSLLELSSSFSSSRSQCHLPDGFARLQGGWRGMVEKEKVKMAGNMGDARHLFHQCRDAWQFSSLPCWALNVDKLTQAKPRRSTTTIPRFPLACVMPDLPSLFRAAQLHSATEDDVFPRHQNTPRFE